MQPPAIAAGYNISIYLSLEATLLIAKLKICVGFSQKTILHCDIEAQINLRTCKFSDKIWSSFVNNRSVASVYIRYIASISKQALYKTSACKMQ